MKRKEAEYHLDENQRFVVENYNWATAFSNFFPGIAGRWGVPMWIFYVSRGQGISSMGVRDKDHSILEFYSFNKALQLVEQQGFRTLIKVDDEIYEPFLKKDSNEVEQRMIISAAEFAIEDVNPKLGLKTRVVYYPLVGEPVAGLVREVEIENLRDESVSLEVIDGLPRILPFGTEQEHIKETARSIEGMMGVETFRNIPIYKLKQTPADISKVGQLKRGNFYLSVRRNEKDLVEDRYIVDPAIVFDEPESYTNPTGFEENSLKELLSKKQIEENRTPCAFTPLSLDLGPKEKSSFCTLIGNVSDKSELSKLFKSLKAPEYFKEKREENKKIISSIQSRAFTVSNSPEFDQHCQQAFLDNVQRGGKPLVMNTKERKSALSIYSRLHGGIERDYHYFVLEPSYLTQGKGWYRDPLQNRRNDVWFFPEVEDLHPSNFMSMIQTDSYNPQTATKITYTVEDLEGLINWLETLVGDSETIEELLESAGESLNPGKFIMELERKCNLEMESKDKILEKLLSFCRQDDVGRPREGFWIDHWTYNLDLVDSFLSVYPEKLKELLIGKEDYTFFDNPKTVKSRKEKHVLTEDGVRQYNSVKTSQEKENLIGKRLERENQVRSGNGKGEIYHTNLMVKLLTIVANRIATLDPRCIGVEMEADKPGWNDALNGLPGLLGSSLGVSLELKRLCRFLKESLSEIDMNGEEISIFEELHEFIARLNESIERRNESEGYERNLEYWKESHTLKEEYREKTKMGISGEERKFTPEEIEEFLDNSLRLLNDTTGGKNNDQVFNESGVPYMYFINSVEEYSQISGKEKEPEFNSSELPLVKPEKFDSRPVSLFLEGPVHMMRVHPEMGEEIYKSVKNSHLYDDKLKMYKVCESLENEPFEIGRIQAYARGWLENESIYLHMEYKWFLELLRSGLYKEFYQEIENALIPFLDPEVYGRSIFEVVSAIVSSPFPDEKLHGQGFQPRLTGATTEMLHMWKIISAGESPFRLDEDGKLVMELDPVLPGWLFTEERKTRTHYGRKEPEKVEAPENSYTFKFLGNTLVVYHNEERKDTFGEDGVGVKSYRLEYPEGEVKEVKGNVLGTELAKDVRSGKVERIDVTLAS